MKEIIDMDSNSKIVCLVICGIKYGDDYYVMYSIKRDKIEDNIFVSKLVLSSMGYVMDNNFFGGEKEVIDEVIRDILNKDNVRVLNNNKIEIIKNIELEGINKFSIDKCYVTTVSRRVVKDVMVNYGLISLDEKKVVVKEKELSTFNEGSISSLFLILFGIFVLIVSGVVIFNAFIK